MSDRSEVDEIVLRPQRRLYSRGFFAVVLFTTPIFAALYWLTIPNGAWSVLIALHVVVIGLAVWAAVQFVRTTIKLVPGGLVERGFLGAERRVRSEDVAEILMFALYQGSSLETTPNLFVADPNGELLLRMRGQFWSVADMDSVAEHLGTPPTRHADPVTVRELRQRTPLLLHWFERGFGARRTAR
jgi:hypothetical protein